MPVRRTVYDKGSAAAKEPARVIEMWDVDAREACARDTRYSLSKPAGFGAKAPPPRARAKADEPPVPDEQVPNE